MTGYLLTMVMSLLFLSSAQWVKVQGMRDKTAPLQRWLYLRRWYWILCTLTFLTVFFTAAIRYNVGNDYQNYIYMFQRINTAEFTSVEIGFKSLGKLIGNVTTDAQWLFVICSFVTLLFIFLGIVRESPSPVVSLYLLFATMHYAYGLSAVRQYLALSICFFGHKHLVEGNFLSYLVYVLTASLFHRSALIMLPLYVLLRLRLKVSQYIAIALTGLLITLFREQVMSLIFSIAYEQYAGSDFLDFHISYYNILQSLLVTVGCIAYYRQMAAGSGNLILMNAAILSFIVYLTIPGWLGNALSRVMLYLNFYHILTIPKIIACESKKNTRVLYNTLMIVSYFVLFLILMHTNRNGGGVGVYPYQTIFSRPEVSA